MLLIAIGSSESTEFIVVTTIFSVVSWYGVVLSRSGVVGFSGSVGCSILGGVLLIQQV